MKIVGIGIMIVLIFGGCEYKYESPCKKAKYISKKELRENYPKVVAPKAVEKAAKIYNYKDGEIILINEQNKGIHLINNRVRETPQNVAFIEIPGNIDMAVKDGYLYVDSFTDLLVLNIKDIKNIQLVYRKEKVFPYDVMQAVPVADKESGECYDYDYKNDAFVIGFE
jgi:ABC-type antimicrobial peptide transport system permease subunit